RHRGRHRGARGFRLATGADPQPVQQDDQAVASCSDDGRAVTPRTGTSPGGDTAVPGHGTPRPFGACTEWETLHRIDPALLRSGGDAQQRRRDLTGARHGPLPGPGPDGLPGGLPGRGGVLDPSAGGPALRRTTAGTDGPRPHRSHRSHRRERPERPERLLKPSSAAPPALQAPPAPPALQAPPAPLALQAPQAVVAPAAPAAPAARTASPTGTPRRPVPPTLPRRHPDGLPVVSVGRHADGHPARRTPAARRTPGTTVAPDDGARAGPGEPARPPPRHARSPQPLPFSRTRAQLRLLRTAGAARTAPGRPEPGPGPPCVRGCTAWCGKVRCDADARRWRPASSLRGSGPELTLTVRHHVTRARV